MQTEGPNNAWHAMTGDEVLAKLNSSMQGLSNAEALARLKSFGPNRLPQAKPRSPLLRFLEQFHNLLIYVLIAAAVLSLLLEHVIDALVILGVVVVNAIIGFVQEGKAEEALASLKGMIDAHCSVLREGRRLTVPAHEVVPGDLLVIEAGDRVAADLRLLKARNLRIEEAILTGESVPVDKASQSLPPSTIVAERKSMAFSGTFVAVGQGLGVAVGTGANSELGRIGSLLRTVETLKTPLIARMDELAQRLTVVILGASALAYAYAHYFRDYSLVDAFMVVVGLAVAAIPEGLPAIMTIALAIGVQRMAARKAIIRRLPAVETLGSVSVICSDKTGTFTRNEMMAASIVTGDGRFDVEGSGYEPTGAIRQDRDSTLPDLTKRPLAELIRAAILCNDAELRRKGSIWMVDGDPMEGALVVLGMKAGLDAGLVRKQLPRTDEIPFDAQHRFMATLHHSHDDGGFVLIKGAPEDVLRMCRKARLGKSDMPINAASWVAAANSLAARGQRVLGFAFKPVPRSHRSLSFTDLRSDAVFLGCVGFIDPPRAEAIEAVRDCQLAGIRVVMITGDHAITAREIGRQLGLAEDPAVLSGEEIAELDAGAFREAVRKTPIFARTTPELKLRLVEALQKDGLTIAMTGDGVNDAPALKRADVGIAMGLKGTEAAKEAAEMVIADDNFASIVAAVQEGRTVYDNLIKVIRWTLPTNGGEAMTILAALALGLALPVTPLQILWINMVTAVALGLTLAFEPTEPDTMRRRPRLREQPILTAGLIWRIIYVSVLFVLAVFGVFFWAEQRGLALEEARTLVVNTIVVMEIFYLFSVRYVHGTSLTWRGVLGTPAVLAGVAVVVAAQLLLTYSSWMNLLFGTRPVALTGALLVGGVGVALLLAVETEKRAGRMLGWAN